MAERISLDLINSIYFGQPIIDAFMLQEDIKYYGMVLHHSAEGYFTQNEQTHDFANKYLFPAKTHMKSGIITYYNLDWLSQFNKQVKKGEDDISIETLFQYVSGPPRIYVDNTLEMTQIMAARG